VTRELLAWHSSPAWLDTALHGVGQFLHGLGNFASSAGFGGAAAVTAALIAARQVGKTRKVEALWARFQWVIEQIGGQAAAAPGGAAPKAADKYTLTSNQATVMLDGIKERCRRVDAHLEDLIDQVLATFVAATFQIVRPDTGHDGEKEAAAIEAPGSAENGGQ
jgi:hypothetical protein